MHGPRLVGLEKTSLEQSCGESLAADLVSGLNRCLDLKRGLDHGEQAESIEHLLLPYLELTNGWQAE